MSLVAVGKVRKLSLGGIEERWCFFLLVCALWTTLRKSCSFGGFVIMNDFMTTFVALMGLKKNACIAEVSKLQHR